MAEEKSIYAHELKVMRHLALEAGTLLLQVRHNPHVLNNSWRKEDQSWVSEADHAAATLIDAALHLAFPEAAILDEETYLHHHAAQDWRTAKRCFMVDPLDSTSSFLRGHPHYGVLIALCENGEPVAGVTYKPELGELYQAALGQGAWRTFAGSEAIAADVLNWQRIEVAPSHRISLVTSHGRITPGLTDLLHSLGQPPSHRMSGSLKVNEVARGEFTAFLSPAQNSMSLWDMAAPSIILSGWANDQSRGPATRLAASRSRFAAGSDSLQQSGA
jgi:3'-phosphoadenosine 5'-phosphosulfate (PAPS) 3'-phosphatase